VYSCETDHSCTLVLPASIRLQESTNSLMDGLSAGSRDSRLIMGALKMPSRLLIAGVMPLPSHGSSCPFNPSMQSITCTCPSSEAENVLHETRKASTRRCIECGAPYLFPRTCRQQAFLSAAQRPSPPVTTHPLPPARLKLVSTDSSYSHQSIFR
jgi:hypothetical protein